MAGLVQVLLQFVQRHVETVFLYSLNNVMTEEQQ